MSVNGEVHVLEDRETEGLSHVTMARIGATDTARTVQQPSLGRGSGTTGTQRRRVRIYSVLAPGSRCARG